MVVYNGSMTTSGLYQKKIQMISEGFQEINPEKILLFGSASSGNINKDSDIDICVVRNADDSLKTKQQLKNIIWDNAIGFEPEIDIHVYSPSVYADRLKRHDPFISEISKGKILYER